MKPALPCLLPVALILAGCAQDQGRIASGPAVNRLASGKPAGVVHAQQTGQTIIFAGAALGIAALGLIASSHAYIIPPASPSSTQ